MLKGKWLLLFIPLRFISSLSSTSWHWKMSGNAKLQTDSFVPQVEHCSTLDFADLSGSKKVGRRPACI